MTTLRLMREAACHRDQSPDVVLGELEVRFIIVRTERACSYFHAGVLEVSR